MTGARFGEVDLDLLADYLVGELDETGRERVAGLIGTDPAWADAYHRLGAADEMVASQLRFLDATPEPMPADVAADLDRALRGAALANAGVDEAALSKAALNKAALNKAALNRAGGDEAGVGAAASDYSALDNVVSLADRRRRRQSRFKLLSLAAAGLVAVVGGGLVVQVMKPDRSELTSEPSSAFQREQDTGGGGAPAVGGETADGSTGFTTVATGRDYTVADLASLDGSTGAEHAEKWLELSKRQPVPAMTGSTSGPEVLPDSVLSERVPPDLRYLLTDPAALRRCVELVDRLQPGRPVFVDLARYRGYAAVVVVLTEPAAIVVRSPDCDRDLR